MLYYADKGVRVQDILLLIKEIDAIENNLYPVDLLCLNFLYILLLKKRYGLSYILYLKCGI